MPTTTTVWPEEDININMWSLHRGYETNPLLSKIHRAIINHLKKVIFYTPVVVYAPTTTFQSLYKLTNTSTLTYKQNGKNPLKLPQRKKSKKFSPQCT